MLPKRWSSGAKTQYRNFASSVLDYTLKVKMSLVNEDGEFILPDQGFRFTHVVLDKNKFEFSYVVQKRREY